MIGQESDVGSSEEKHIKKWKETDTGENLKGLSLLSKNTVG